MEVRHVSLTGAPAGDSAAVALGFFDGVHTAHLALLRETVAVARKRGVRSAAFTFAEISTDAKNKAHLTTAEEREKRIADAGIDLLYVASFAELRDLAPADFVGNAPLSAPEARAMYDFTLSLSPRLVLAYHTQGMVIYSGFDGLEPPGSTELAARLSAASGYASESAPYASGFAGYKDWFIQDYARPGYTVEAGRGINPLPISDFDEIYSRNLGILVYGALV